MAKILGKDEVAYARERDGFLRDLQHFHESRGTPFRRSPKISGHEIDLYLLYSLVTAEGGWIKVNSKNEWSDLFECFRLPAKLVNGSVALKQIYLRYLDRWEKVHFLGEEADRGSDDDEESRHKRWSARALHSVPVTYNYQQHNIAESTREYNSLSTHLYKSSEYDRLALSLISPLPNEQDFAINVCTLLSNDGKHTLKVEKHPRIIDYLLAHAGVFKHDSLRRLFVHIYSEIRRHPMHTFWKDVVKSDEYLNLVDESKFQEPRPTTKSKIKRIGTRKAPETNDANPLTDDANQTASVVANVTTDSDCLVLNDLCSDGTLSINRDGVVIGDGAPSSSGNQCQMDKDDDDDDELFNLGRDLGTRDYVGQRILQIATIMRNLSFIDENLSVLVKNKTFVRFALLCSCTHWGPLRNLGLDMLGNLVTEYIIRDNINQGDQLIGKLMMRIVVDALRSEDRNLWITALEVLNKLGQNESNEDTLSRTIEPYVYERACSFLTIQDVMLLIYTLECLYSLSSLGERPCNCIVNHHGVVDVLVALVTVEGKSYGPKACIGMKLVETVPGGCVSSTPFISTSASLSLSSTSSATGSATVTATVATLASSSNIIASSSTTTTTTSVLQTMTAKSLPSTPQRPVVQIAPQRLIAVTPTTAISANVTTTVTQVATTPQQQHLVQQQHAHQQAIQENEQFALAWLRATYEPWNNSRIDHQELYKHYINSCAKIGRRGVIAPLHFPRCVRSVFGGTVGPNPTKPSSTTETQYYDGIKVRLQPLPITLHPATASTNATVMAHPHLSQALLGGNVVTATTTTGQLSINKDIQIQTTTTTPGQTNTSLIKSLLATKVNECMTPVSMRTASDCQNVAQVAARQQQQKLLAQQANASTSMLETKTVIQKIETPKTTTTTSRLNGARQQLFVDGELCDPSVSSTTATQAASNATKNRKEPPQPPPPPLAPLSNNNNNNNSGINMGKGRPFKIENEDSDSIGNNSLASSTGIGNVGLSGISSTEDCDNSLTSFEGILLNGLPSIDNPLNMNDDSNNSKDSIKNTATTTIVKNKPLMLADLLEKKIDKDPPALNGVLGKELRIGEKGLELVENHIEKALSKENNGANSDTSSFSTTTTENGSDNANNKRRAIDDIVDSEPKKPHLATSNNVTNVNGNVDSPATDSVSSSNGDDAGSGTGGTGATSTVSTAAAKLFADIAADILEDEEEEMMQQEAQQHQVAASSSSSSSSSTETPAPTPATTIRPQQQTVAATAVPAPAVPQVFVENNPPVLMAQQATTRQIIVSQPQIQATNQVVLTTGAQLKTAGVIVQNSSHHQPRAPMVLQQNAGGQLLLAPGQVQLVASTSQPGQYVLQTSGGQGAAYVVAQSQTAVVHGQPQTVLVTQTPQQQGTAAKTIIILQQPNAAAHHHHHHHQKLVVTPQGQQVVVTPVPRPLMHTSTVTNNLPVLTNVMKSISSATVTVTPSSTSNNNGSGAVSNGNNNSGCITTVTVKQEPETKVQPTKPKIVRDLTAPFVCEWDDCQVETKFTSANQVYLHACEVHCAETFDEMVCQWDRCDNMKRKRFSMMTHLYDKHCNTEAMRANFVRRKQIAQGSKVETPTSTAVTPHPGYAPDAALHAIKRHALEFVNPKELQDDNEGPVTKSIRLTASLILRNLVIYSTNCRRYLKHYEPHLANVALSNVESSRTIAQVLYDMNDGSNLR